MNTNLHPGADDARFAPDAEVSLSDVRFAHAFGVVLRVPRPAQRERCVTARLSRVRAKLLTSITIAIAIGLI